MSSLKKQHIQLNVPPWSSKAKEFVTPFELLVDGYIKQQTKDIPLNIMIWILIYSHWFSPILREMNTIDTQIYQQCGQEKSKNYLNEMYKIEKKNYIILKDAIQMLNQLENKILWSTDFIEGITATSLMRKFKIILYNSKNISLIIKLLWIWIKVEENNFECKSILMQNNNCTYMDQVLVDLLRKWKNYTKIRIYIWLLFAEITKYKNNIDTKIILIDNGIYQCMYKEVNKLNSIAKFGIKHLQLIEAIVRTLTNMITKRSIFDYNKNIIFEMWQMIFNKTNITFNDLTTIDADKDHDDHDVNPMLSTCINIFIICIEFLYHAIKNDKNSKMFEGIKNSISARNIHFFQVLLNLLKGNYIQNYIIFILYNISGEKDSNWCDPIIENLINKGLIDIMINIKYNVTNKCNILNIISNIMCCGSYIVQPLILKNNNLVTFIYNNFKKNESIKTQQVSLKIIENILLRKEKELTKKIIVFDNVKIIQHVGEQLKKFGQNQRKYQFFSTEINIVKICIEFCKTANNHDTTIIIKQFKNKEIGKSIQQKLLFIDLKGKVNQKYMQSIAMDRYIECMEYLVKEFPELFVIY